MVGRKRAGSQGEVGMSLPDPRLQNGYSGNLLTKGKLLKINSNCTSLCQKLSVLTRQIPSPMQPQVEQAGQVAPKQRTGGSRPSLMSGWGRGGSRHGWRGNDESNRIVLDKPWPFAQRRTYIFPISSSRDSPIPCRTYGGMTLREREEPSRDTRSALRAVLGEM